MNRLLKISLAQDDEEEFARFTGRKEKGFIGAIVRENTLMDYALGHVTPATLNLTRHRLLFAAVVELHKRREAISPESILSELRSRNKLEGAGGEENVNSLGEDVPPALTVEREDYVERFAAVAALLAVEAAILSETDLDEIAKMMGEKVRAIKELKGKGAESLPPEGAGPVN